MKKQLFILLFIILFSSFYLFARNETEIALQSTALKDEKLTRRLSLNCYTKNQAFRNLCIALEAEQSLDFRLRNFYKLIYQTSAETHPNSLNIKPEHILALLPYPLIKNVSGIGAVSALNIQKKTFLVIYRPGAAWIKGKPVSEQPLAEHGKYLLGLYKLKFLRFAGPFAGDAGGAAVLEVSDEIEAKNLVNRDPAVISGVMVYELHSWQLVPWENYIKK